MNLNTREKEYAKSSIASVERILKDNRINATFLSYGSKEINKDKEKFIEFSINNKEPFMIYFYYFIWSFIKMNAASKVEQSHNLISQSLSTPLLKLLNEEEAQGLEFKDSFQWSYKDNCKMKNLAGRVSKTIRAFLNSSGGVLIIGIDDKTREILGRDPDLDISDDDFLLRINNQIKKDPGPTYLNPSYSTSEYVSIKEKTILAIKVYPSPHPVFSPEGELVWRTDNSSHTASSHQEAHEYINRWWTE